MIRRKVSRTAALAMAMWLTGGLASGPVRADSGTELSVGAEHSWGKYGSVDETDSWYYPVTLRHWQERWTWGMTLPYMRISGPAAVVGSLGNQIVFTPNTGMVRKTTSGMGDIEASATYLALNDGESGWQGNVTTKLKLPTGDASAGLGTGSRDYAVEGTLQRSVGAVTAFGNSGWRHMGNAGTTVLNNVWYMTLGANYALLTDVRVGGAWSYRQALVDGGASLRQWTVFLAYTLAPGLAINAYVLKGYTDASPENGGGVMVSHAF